MSRPSIDSISVATVSIPLRAEAPKELNDRQRQLWSEITSTKPPDWFESDSFPLLKAYVIAADYHERLTASVELIGPAHEDAKKLLVAQDMQAKLLANLGVKMRLTQQSRYTPQAAATANKKTPSGAKPWD